MLRIKNIAIQTFEEQKNIGFPLFIGTVWALLEILPVESHIALQLLGRIFT